MDYEVNKEATMRRLDKGLIPLKKQLLRQTLYKVANDNSVDYERSIRGENMLSTRPMINTSFYFSKQSERSPDKVSKISD